MAITRVTCKGICSRHKADRPIVGGGQRYALEQKRCRVCEIFIYFPGIYCPCCGQRLRMRPRLGRDRAKLFALQGQTQT